MKKPPFSAQNNRRSFAQSPSAFSFEEPTRTDAPLVSVPRADEDVGVPGAADKDVDVVFVPLKDAAGQIRLVGIPALKLADPGVVEAKGLEKVVGKCLSVERRFGQCGDGFFDLNCVHADTQSLMLTSV